MRRFLFAAFLVLLVCAAAVPAGAGETGYFAVSLFDPVQYPDSATSIRGLRLNVFYSEHHDLTGLDLGIPFFLVPLNTLNGTLFGFQSGFYNESRRVHPMGFQWGTMNYTREHLAGLQVAGGTSRATRSPACKSGSSTGRGVCGGSRLAASITRASWRGFRSACRTFAADPALEPPARPPTVSSPS